MSETCGAESAWSDGHAAICQLAPGHDGPHRDDRWRAVSDENGFTFADHKRFNAAVVAQRDGLQARIDTVTEFCAERAQYITAIENCAPDNDRDYYRWQGHAEARRQLSQRLGLPVGWPTQVSQPQPEPDFDPEALEREVDPFSQQRHEGSSGQTQPGDRVPCPEGFHWVGQSFAHCDECGLPAWEHAGEARSNPDVPFSLDAWVLRPWREGEAEAIRRKWDPTRAEVSQPKPEPGPQPGDLVRVRLSSGSYFEDTVDAAGNYIHHGRVEAGHATVEVVERAEVSQPQPEPDFDPEALEHEVDPFSQPRTWNVGDPEPHDVRAVQDKHGDVWQPDGRGQWWTPETRPFPWQHLAKKWGPLTEVSRPQEGPQQ